MQKQKMTPQLDQEGEMFVTEVTGVFLCYDRAIDSLMLPALSVMTSKQKAPTKNTM